MHDLRAPVSNTIGEPVARESISRKHSTFRTAKKYASGAVHISALIETKWEFRSGLPIARNLRHTEGMNSRLSGPGTDRLRVALSFVACVTWSIFVGADQPLFADDEVFDLTINVPYSKLMRQAGDDPDVSGTLELSDGTSVPMSCNKYGISRLRECDLASLQITVDVNEAHGTPFEGREILRLVTPCRLRGAHDKYTMLEYLVYKSYALIADTALRVRLVNVNFRGSEKSPRAQNGYAFFIEDIGEAAARRGQVWLDIQSQRTSDLDAAQLTLMTLFQYMVGNTDWSAVKGRPDDRCCHNVAVFGQEDVDLNTVVPFDFDQTGLVNPPYAAPPAPSLGIRQVTQRKYRGLCEHNPLLPAAIALFNSKRPELEALFNRDDLPYPKDRERALKYIRDFYDTINDPGKLKKKIIGDCR